MDRNQVSQIAIEVLYFEGCPNHEATVALVREVVAELGIDARIEPIAVESTEAVRRLLFLGSPSVRVNGIDIDPNARGRSDYNFACRKYGQSGVPSRSLVENALKEVFGASP